MVELTDSVEGADPPALKADWERFERTLRAHLELEEREIVPAVERVDPKAAARVREDHAEIRASLDELGVEVELHTLRKETVDRFLTRLRDHAAREDATLYRIADEVLAPSAVSQVLAHINTSAR